MVDKEIEEWISYTPNDDDVFGIEELKDVELFDGIARLA